MAGKTAILAVRIISSATGDGFRKAARQVDLFSSKLKRFGTQLKTASAPVTKFARTVGRIAAPIAKVSAIAGAATVAISGLTVPLVAMTSAAAAALGPMLALGAAMAPSALGAGALVVGALSMAFKGMGDAMAAADPEAFAEAIKAMGPAARAAATQLNGMAAQFRDLGKVVQESFWANVSNIGDLAVLIAPIGAALKTTAADLGNATAGLVEFVSQGSGLSAMKTLLLHSSVAASGLGYAFADVVKGIISVGAAAGPILAELTQNMSTAAEGWAERMNAGFTDGSLQAYFRDAQAAARAFGAVLSDIGGIIGGVWSAMSAAGQPMLSVIRDSIGATNEWIHSAQGMSMLTEWFSQMGAAVGVLMPILGQLAQIIIGTISPAIADLVQAIAPASSALVGAFGSIVAAIAPILRPLGQIVNLFGTALAGALQALMPIIASVSGILTRGLQTAFTALEPLMPVIADAFAQLATAIGPLLPSFETLLTAVVAILPPFVELVSAILPGLVEVITAVAPLVAQVAVVFAEVLTALMPILPPLADLAGALLPALAAIIGAVVAILSPFISLASKIASILAGALTIAVSAVSVVLQGLAGFFGGVANAISTVVGWVQSLISWIGKIKWPSAPGWLSSIFSAPEDPMSPPDDRPRPPGGGSPTGGWGRFTAGNFGFLRAGPAVMAAPAEPAVYVTVNVSGAVISNDYELADLIENALRKRNRANGRSTAGGR